MFLKAFLVAAALAASGAHSLHRAHKVSIPRTCTTSATTPFGIVVRGVPAYQIGSGIDCRTSVYYLDMRLCPQQLVNGQWQFIPGTGGWSFGSGTCHDSGWTATSATWMTWQFASTPGATYRSWTESWENYDGTVIPVIATSPAWTS